MTYGNKARIRRALLERAKLKWKNRVFDRVGADVYNEIDRVIDKWMDNFIASHPSVGKTLSTGRNS